MLRFSSAKQAAYMESMGAACTFSLVEGTVLAKANPAASGLILQCPLQRGAPSALGCDAASLQAG